MNLYGDLEFTGLHQKTTIISLALISEDNIKFYAEFNDYDETQINDWLRENVISHLKYKEPQIETSYLSDNKGYNVYMMNCTKVIVEELQKWLTQFDEIDIWFDCGHYDWVLFCELFGGAMNIPKNIHYIPLDLNKRNIRGKINDNTRK